MIDKMTKEMQAAARILDFETAAYYRDEITKLRDGSYLEEAAKKPAKTGKRTRSKKNGRVAVKASAERSTEETNGE